MFAHLIGKQSHRMKNKVERGMVKRFAEAIGDPHDIFINEEIGKQSRYKNNIAPPTFPQVFDYGQIEGLILPSKGLIHGEQRFHYKRPLLIEDEINCFMEVIDYTEKSGKSGLMSFVTIKKYGQDLQDETIFTIEQIIIIPEVVREGMKR